MPRPAIRLRATRAAPPGLATDDDERRALFSAALQQSEELFEAAAAVGPLARPLPLFYALSQAGRAIVAAWAKREWRVAGHGLAEDRAHTEWRAGDILGFRIRPQERPGVFGSVASTLGATGLTGSVELGSLWSALPGLNRPEREGSRVALPVWPQLYLQEQSFVLHMGAPHRGYVSLREQAPTDDATAINALLAHYPAAAGAQVELAQGIVAGRQTPWGMGVPVRWPAPAVEQTPEGPPPPKLLASQVHNRVPEYRYQREHWLIPVVGEGNDELPPLLLWWVLLFGLSLLSRYEPSTWRAALDPDRSELAVPLEELLEEGLSVGPDLLYEATAHEPVLLPPQA